MTNEHTNQICAQPNVSRYPVKNAYAYPDFYRSVKRDFDEANKTLIEQTPLKQDSNNRNWLEQTPLKQKMENSKLQPMTNQQHNQAFELAKQIRPKNITISDTDYNLATSPLARKMALAYQGLANSTFNPFGYAAHAADIDTRPVEANSGLERGIEAASGALYDTIPLVYGGEALASANWGKNMSLSANPWLSRLGRGINYLGTPNAPALELGGTVGGSTLPAMVNLQYPGVNAPLWDKSLYYGGNFGLGIVGGTAGAGLAGGSKKPLRQE